MSDSKNLTVPPFQSKLPPEFVEGLDHRGKYLYETIDKVTQAQEWLMQRAVVDAGTLAEVREQTYKTNGQVIQAKKDILDLKDELVSARPAIKTVNFSLKMVKNKWFWAGAIAFFTFVVPWLISHNQGILEFLKLLLG